MMKRLISDIAAILTILEFCGCSGFFHEEEFSEEVYIDCGRSSFKSALIDEEVVWDINLWVYSPDGIGEYHTFIPYSKAQSGIFKTPLHLLMDREYEFFVIANAGYDIGFPSRKELMEYKLHLAHPDGNSKGMPMSSHSTQKTSSGKAVTLALERLMSRINVSVDKSKLRKDVGFNVMNVRICNCPQSVTPFRPSSVTDAGDCFSAGYFREGSERMQLYMLENIAQDIEYTSYVEMEIDYESDCFHSYGRGLIYRFRIREDEGYKVMRNCCYNITVVPDKDGLLCEDSWKVDKSYLQEWDKDPYLLIDPSGTMVDGSFYEHYYEMSKGETRHFRLVRHPGNMVVRLRQDLVDLESEEGRAIYTLDRDMNGFSVTALDRACLSSMEIEGAYPLNDCEMISIRVR